MPARWILAALLLAATPAAAEDLRGTFLYRLCMDATPLCGEYIRAALKSAGWAERVPFKGMLEQGKLEWFVCPTTDPRDAFLARAYREFWGPRFSDLETRWAKDTVVLAFRQRDDIHDCSASKGL